MYIFFNNINNIPNNHPQSVAGAQKYLSLYNYMNNYFFLLQVFVSILISAIALFFAWIEMTLMLGRRPSIGKYTYMSIQVIGKYWVDNIAL